MESGEILMTSCEVLLSSVFLGTMKIGILVVMHEVCPMISHIGIL